jgi:Phage integrase, N-terminal SAM-like domain
MAYNWRPAGSRAATTTAPRAVVPPRPPPTRSPLPPVPREEEISVSAVIDEFIEAAEDGRVGNRSGRRYRPSALRDLRGILRFHVAHDIGHMPLRDVRRRHVQALVDRLAGEGLSESRIRSVISAMRALYGYAIDRGYVELSPAGGLVLPSEEAALEEDRTNPGSEDGPADFAWTDKGDDSWENEPLAGSRPRGRLNGARRAWKAPTPDRSGSDYQPIALLPERILSLVLRIVVVIFILFALVTIAQSA